MRGIKPENVPKFVQKDVALVMKEARYVISIDAECVVNVAHNPSGGLLVVAVVGPGFLRGDITCSQRVFHQALLLEIGIWRGRPYRKASVSKNRPSITYRRQWFSPTDEQWMYVARELSKLLAERVRQQTSLWKAGTHKKPFFVSGRRRFVTGRSITNSPRLIPKISGLCVSVPYPVNGAPSAVNDFLRAGIDGCDVDGFARYVDKVINTHSVDDGVNEIRRTRLPDYVVAYMVAKRLNDSRASSFERGRWGELAYYGNFCNEPLSRELLLARAAQPGFAQRLSGINVRFVRSNHHYVTFEVLSSSPPPA